MRIQPLAPSEVLDKKSATIPDEVLDVFNHYIARNWTGKESVVLQDDVMKELVTRRAAVATVQITDMDDYLARYRKQIYDEHWMDVEETYRAAGWQVVYDRPAYCESYPASFTFRKAATE